MRQVCKCSKRGINTLTGKFKVFTTTFLISKCRGRPSCSEVCGGEGRGLVV